MNQDQKKKPIVTITPVRKATEEELKIAARREKEQKEKGKPYLTFTFPISNLPEGRAFFPTHDFNVIKEYRDRLFYTVRKPEFVDEGTIKGMITTPEDLIKLRTDWLKETLLEIDRISKTPGLSIRDMHELSKYRDDVTRELDHKSKNPKPAKPLTLREQALIAIYEGEVITKAQGKLHDHFEEYSHPLNRTGTGTWRETSYQIRRFEHIMPGLSSEAKARATSDFNKLKENLDKNFPEKTTL